MSRYDWPAPPRSRDDQAGRARFTSRFLPSADPTRTAPPAPPPAAGAASVGPAGLAPAGTTDLWLPIGPSVMVRGQASGDPNVAGRIRDLAVEPGHGLRAYAGSGSGGVWFTGDAGASWRPLDEWATSTGVTGRLANAMATGALYVRFGAAADGSADEVWVGTGEGGLWRDGRPSALYPNNGGALPGGEVRGIGFLHATGPATGPATGSAWTHVLDGVVDISPNPLSGQVILRISGDPANSDLSKPLQLAAATSNGLYVLPAGGSWTQQAGWTAGTPLDVVLTRASANTLRIWVAVAGGLYVAEFSGAPGTPISGSLTFTPVPLPGPTPAPTGTSAGQTIPLGNVQLAASADGKVLYVLARRFARTGKDADKMDPAQLWSVDATAATDKLGSAATAVSGLPSDLFGASRDGDQSGYDMAIAVHPDEASRVYVGGSGATYSGQWNAALYRCEISGTTATPTRIGSGVHADVHAIRLGEVVTPGTKRSVWVGCDGGLFRSDADGDADSFTAVNDGLAVLEPGFVASHPTNPGIVVAGFQDNGTALRVGDTVWRQTFRGDGGGVTWDPAGTRYMRQYIHADWSSSTKGAVAPVLRRGAWTKTGSTLVTSESLEDGASQFYSGADSVVHGGLTHFAMGTDRVWYTTDWGGSWVTLPSATDPRAHDRPDLKQDVYNPSVPLDANKAPAPTYADTVGSTDSCSSTYTGDAYTGTGLLAVRFATPPDSGGTHTLRVLALYPQGLGWYTGTRATSATGAFSWAKPSPSTPLIQQVFREPAAADAAAMAAGGPLTSLPPGNGVSDLAVHDAGRGALGSCYVATTGGADAAHDTLWFFDGDGTWWACGVTRVIAGRTSWTGSPSSAPALAVEVDPTDSSTVYVGTSVGVLRGRLTIGSSGGNPTYSWAWERITNGLPECAVQDLSVFASGGVRLLRAALQARGIYELDLSGPAVPLTYLRLYPSDTRRVLPSVVNGDLLSGEPGSAHWDESPDVVVDTSGTTWSAPPSEAALLGMLPSPGERGARASVEVPGDTAAVHVLVHHRAGSAVAAGQVRVALLRHDLPDDGVVPISALWPVLVSAAGSGTPPVTLPDGWTSASSALWQSPVADIDVRRPVAVTFSVDFSALSTAIVLLAVVMSGTDQISSSDLTLSSTLTATTADQLVLASPHAGARTVEPRSFNAWT
ncbi:MAG TPA: hypothetical protein VMI11_13945 [Actinomycetes bacterium]|nr:hypothetical protein [Actinomycetes bacterium]